MLMFEGHKYKRCGFAWISSINFAIGEAYCVHYFLQ